MIEEVFPEPETNDLKAARLLEMSDELLVQSAQSGDASSFVELVKRHGERIKAQIRHITKNWEDAEDVFQEAILRAFIHLNTFEGRSRFSTWLTRIAINSALMRIRRKRAVELPFESFDDGYQKRATWEPIDAGDTPEEGLVKREREELMKNAISRLPQSLRVVIQMRRAQGCSLKDIASALGISIQAVKSRMTRARGILRITLGTPKRSLLFARGRLG